MSEEVVVEVSIRCGKREVKQSLCRIPSGAILHESLFEAQGQRGRAAQVMPVETSFGRITVFYSVEDPFCEEK